MNGKPLNTAYEAFGLFFHPAYMQMTLAGGGGPHHVPSLPGAEAAEDGSVTFRYFAPDARRVEVAGNGGGFSAEKIPMTRDDAGLWTAAVRLPPGFHYVRFFVDGSPAVNAQAPVAYGCHETINFVEVPDPEDDSYLMKDVPHGTVHMEVFRSSRTGQWHNAWIYSPPSYGREPARRYPVLYLHHGGGENETGWLWQGKIACIADNLIHEGLAEELLIVMPCMYDIRYDAPDEFLPGDYDALLTQDLMPLIDERWRTIPESRARAIAGLSMGSYHSAQVSCNHPGLFAYTAMLSGAFDDRWYRWVDCRKVIAESETFRCGTKLFFMSVGRDEARLLPQVRENLDFLRAHGVPCEGFECPGFHEWTVWRKAIRVFLTRIFKEV